MSVPTYQLAYKGPGQNHHTHLLHNSAETHAQTTLTPQHSKACMTKVSKHLTRSHTSTITENAKMLLYCHTYTKHIGVREVGLLFSSWPRINRPHPSPDISLVNFPHCPPIPRTPRVLPQYAASIPNNIPMLTSTQFNFPHQGSQRSP